MKYQILRRNIQTLANLPQRVEPTISAYFNLQQPIDQVRQDFDLWVSRTQKTFEGTLRSSFEESSHQISRWLTNENCQGKGASLFARSSQPGLFLPTCYNVPVETAFFVDSRPAIFPLVELKDRFSRFVVVMTNAESARIIEMNLGETSLEVLTERPDLRIRHGREWTRQHYLNHTAERGRKFVREKVEIIEDLMNKKGHNALIVVGEARYVKRLKEALPKHLSEKVVEQIHTSFTDQRVGPILEDVINGYVKVEAAQSESAVKRLFRAYRMNRMAVLGVDDSTNALREGMADELIINSTLNHSDREQLVRLASRQGVPIETIENSPLLEEQGGVGVILRYRVEPSSITSASFAA